MSCPNFFSKLVDGSTPETFVIMTETIEALRHLLHAKDEEIRTKDECVSRLENELKEKEALIVHLQNEIDKFRQVVRPITQKIITKQLSLGDDGWGAVDGGKVVTELRTKRQAISAEPLSNRISDEYQITKTPKSQQ